MHIADIRDLDALDVLFVLGGMVSGGVLGAIGWATLAPITPMDTEIVAAVAAACGVGAIKLRRAYRKPEIDNRYVEPPPVVGIRSLLSGVLVGVGALVCLAGFGGLALMIAFVTSKEAERVDGAWSYLLIPAMMLAAGIGMVWMGLQRPQPRSSSR